MSDLSPFVVILLVGILPAAIAAPGDARNYVVTTVEISTPHAPPVSHTLARNDGAERDPQQPTARSRVPDAAAPDMPRANQSDGANADTVPGTPMLDLRLPEVDRVQATDSAAAGTPADAGDLGVVTIATGLTPLAIEAAPDAPGTGLGAIYWAARHPADAWRVLLPVAPRDESASAQDSSADCAPPTGPAIGPSPCPGKVGEW